jgi:hypothetical protein
MQPGRNEDLQRSSVDSHPLQHLSYLLISWRGKRQYCTINPGRFDGVLSTLILHEDSAQPFMYPRSVDMNTSTV